MVEYSEVNVKLSDTQPKKLKTAVKDERNAFNNCISTDLKLSKAQMSKTIKSGWFLGHYWVN